MEFDHSHIERLVELERKIRKEKLIVGDEVVEFNNLFYQVKISIENSPIDVERLMEYTREMAKDSDEYWNEKLGEENDSLRADLEATERKLKKLAELVRPYL